MSGFGKLNKEIVSPGLCHDCGTCAGLCPDKCLKMDYYREEPVLEKKCSSKTCSLCYDVCPGKDIPMLDLERSIFGRERGAEEMLLGIGQDFVKCHASEAAVRENGGGGGVISALLIYALDQKIIDGAVIVGMDNNRPWTAMPVIAASKAEIIAAAQPKETVVPVNAVLSQAIEAGFKNLAVVGLPCHVHGLRKARMLGKPDWVVDHIKFLIGPFCGMNYSTRAIEHIIVEWAEVPLEQVRKVDYRKGPYPGKFTVTTKSGQEISVPLRAQHGVQQAYEHDRCMACYDYSNELADVSIGDYFGLEMTPGAPRESTAIVRTDTGKKLFKGAIAGGYIQEEPVDREDFFRGNFESKKHGGAYRITRRRKYGLPYPCCQLPLDYRSMPRKINLSHPLVS